MSKKFREDLGVYICPHIFESKGPVLEAFRDSDGYWQFFCGGEHDWEKELPKLVCVGHFTDLDPSIHELTSLNPNEFAERGSIEAPWEFGKIED